MSATHRVMVATALVPVPEPLPAVVHGPRRGYPFSFYDEADHSICLLPTDWMSRFAFYHELGHCFDRMYLTPETRRRAARLIGHPGLRWWWGSWNPLRHVKQPNEENFADVYAMCAMTAQGYPRFREFLREVKP